MLEYNMQDTHLQEKKTCYETNPKEQTRYQIRQRIRECSKEPVIKYPGISLGRIRQCSTLNMSATNQLAYHRLPGYSTNEGPKILPIAHTSGIIVKALGCNSFRGTSSATNVFRTPVFP